MDSANCESKHQNSETAQAKSREYGARGRTNRRANGHARARWDGGSGQPVAIVAAAAAVDKASTVHGPDGKDSKGCGGRDGWTEQERKASLARPLISPRSVRNPMLRPRASEGETKAKKLASVLYESSRWTGGGGGGSSSSDGGGK